MIFCLIFCYKVCFYSSKWVFFDILIFWYFNSLVEAIWFFALVALVILFDIGIYSIQFKPFCVSLFDTLRLWLLSSRTVAFCFLLLASWLWLLLLLGYGYSTMWVMFWYLIFDIWFFDRLILLISWYFWYFWYFLPWCPVCTLCFTLPQSYSVIIFDTLWYSLIFFSLLLCCPLFDNLSFW